MLEELHVRDLALIDDVWLEFGPGMNVLTGETGAGKTALVGALKLLLGERGDAMLVRSGAAEALLEGRFLVDGEEVVVRRRVSAEGRSRCTMDDEMVTVAALASRLGPLVDLHGQHDHQALLSPASHVGYLDRHAGPEVLQALEQYRLALEQHAEAEAVCRERSAALADAARQADYLAFVATEIADAGIREGEDEELEARLPGLRHGERLSAAALEAVQLLRGEGGASDAIAAAAASLGKAAALDPALDALSERLVDGQAALDEVGIALRSYAERIEHDPHALDAIEDRLAALASLKKKYGPTLDDVLRTGADAVVRLDFLAAGQDGLGAAEESVRRAETVLRDRAAALVSVRRASVDPFVKALGEACRELAMTSSRFEVAFTELPFESWTSSGPHKVEFLFSASAGEAVRPLSRVASGGEVSRVMLAIKSVLGHADDVSTLVFDEIDSGIGGTTAHAVGRRLCGLAAAHQVIVVTHLAQVAAFADTQLVVARDVTTDGGCTSTSVRQVAGDERVVEIARMLSGSDSEESLAHASQLLKAARV